MRRRGKGGRGAAAEIDDDPIADPPAPAPKPLPDDEHREAVGGQPPAPAPKPLFEVAREHREAGDAHAAIAVLLQCVHALDQSPALAECLHELSELYAETGAVDAAVVFAQAERAVLEHLLAPGSDRAALADLAIEQQQFGLAQRYAAQEISERGLEDTPDETVAKLGVALTMDARERYQEALDRFRNRSASPEPSSSAPASPPPAGEDAPKSPATASSSRMGLYLMLAVIALSTCVLLFTGSLLLARHL